jgi:CRISPR-associated endonuclease/helicase Cas3
LLIQRMGRLHRHTRDSSGNFLTVAQAQHTRNAPIFYIYGPQPTSTPQTDWLKAILPDTQRIYQDVGKLWLTQQLLIEQGTVTMPDQARTLIESVYGHLKKDIPSTLEKLSNEAEGKQYCDRSQANFNRISPCEGYCWESSNHGGWSEEINTPTRLGDDMTEIILVVSEQDQLRPYAVEAQQFQWDMSTLAIHTINLDKLNKFPPEILAKLETLKKQVPQLKNYSVLVPMIHDKVKDEYLIYQYDHLIAHYSLKFGLEFE